MPGSMNARKLKVRHNCELKDEISFHSCITNNMSKSIWLDKNLLRSSAFRSLKKWSLLVYLDLLRKRQMEQIKKAKRSDEWIIRNNGEIVYPYSEAENKGIGRREFRNAIDELIEKGFLDITHQGSGGRSGDMSKYSLDDRWIKHGTSSFCPTKNPRKKDSRGGRGWSAYHAGKKKFSVTKRTPKKKHSSNKSDTPRGNTVTASSNKAATPNRQKNNVIDCNQTGKSSIRQLNLWSNNSDTIL